MTDIEKDLLKNLFKYFSSFLISASIPAGAWWWPQMLPFLNPLVPAQLAPGSILLASIIALFVCLYSREPRPPASPSIGSVILASVGLVVAIIGFMAMIFLSGRFVLLDPNWESLSIRFAYLSFILGLGAPIGWGLSRAF